MIHMHLLKFQQNFLMVLNCRKWPQELVLDCHNFPLVTLFKPRAGHPNSLLMPSSSVQMREKWKGH